MNRVTLQHVTLHNVIIYRYTDDITEELLHVVNLSTESMSLSAWIRVHPSDRAKPDSLFHESFGSWRDSWSVNQM